MTKKDFIALANAIRCANQQANLRMGQTSEDMRTGIAFARDYISAICLEPNPRFKREIWLDYIAGKCGPNGGKK